MASHRGNALRTRRQALVALAVLGMAPLRLRAALREQTVPARQARPLRVAAALPSAVELASPAAVRLGGWLGARVALNASVRLRTLLENDDD